MIGLQIYDWFANQVSNKRKHLTMLVCDIHKVSSSHPRSPSHISSLTPPSVSYEKPPKQLTSLKALGGYPLSILSPPGPSSPSPGLPLDSMAVHQTTLTTGYLGDQAIGPKGGALAPRRPDRLGSPVVREFDGLPWNPGKGQGKG